MQVKGWVKSTLLDYPGRIAASLFCGGCNFRCPNCHNSDLVLHPEAQPTIPEDEIWRFLERRRGLLDGVVISGGEPTLQRDLLDFAARVRDLGYLVKLDTNGYLPHVLSALLDAGVLDYVAMDVKAPLPKYARAAGMPVDVERIQRSIALLQDSDVAHEFRTTVVPGLLEQDDIVEIARLVAGRPSRVSRRDGGGERLYLQQFIPRSTLDPALMRRVPYPRSRLEAMADAAREWVAEVALRGV